MLANYYWRCLDELKYDSLNPKKYSRFLLCQISSGVSVNIKSLYKINFLGIILFRKVGWT